MNISEDLHNYGEWRTTETNLNGTGNQMIFCGTENYFEPSSFLSVSGTPNLIQANTDIYIKSKFLLNSNTISMNTKKLILSINGKFEDGILSSCKNIYFENGATLGSSGANLELVGDSIFLYNLARLGGLNFDGTIVVKDTMINIFSPKRTPRWLILKL